MQFTDKPVTIGLDISVNKTGFTINVDGEYFKYVISNGKIKVLPDMMSIDYKRLLDKHYSETLLKIVSSKKQADVIWNLFCTIFSEKISPKGYSIDDVEWRYEELSLAKLGSNSKLADLAIYSSSVIGLLIEKGISIDNLKPITGQSLKKWFLGSTKVVDVNTGKKRSADKDDMIAKYMQVEGGHYVIETGMVIDDVVDSWCLATMKIPSNLKSSRKKPKKKTKN